MSLYEVDLLIYLLLFVLPYELLTYYIFDWKFRVNKYIAMSIYICQTIIIIYCFILLYTVKGIDIVLIQQIKFLSILSYAASSYLLIDESIYKSLYVFFLIAIYYCLIQGVANYCAARFGFLFGNKVRTINIYSLVQLAITCPIIIYFIKTKFRRFIFDNDSDVWKIFWCIPAIFFLFVGLFTFSLDDRMFSENRYVLIRILSAVGALMTSLVCYKATVMENARDLLMNKICITENEVKMQRAYYDNLIKDVNYVRQLRHDIRHHMNVIYELCNRNQIDALKKYLTEYHANLPESTQYYLCDNAVFNIIACYYKALCESENIEADFKISAENSDDILENDMSIILGNLLENAYEACKNMKGSKKFIKIRSRMKLSRLVICIENSYEGNLNIKNGKFLSNKEYKFNHGIGLESVKHVVYKNNGSIDIDYTDSVFSVIVII